MSKYRHRNRWSDSRVEYVAAFRFRSIVCLPPPPSSTNDAGRPSEGFEHTLSLRIMKKWSNVNVYPSPCNAERCVQWANERDLDFECDYSIRSQQLLCLLHIVWETLSAIVPSLWNDWHVCVCVCISTIIHCIRLCYLRYLPPSPPPPPSATSWLFSFAWHTRTSYTQSVCSRKSLLVHSFCIIRSCCLDPIAC